MLRYRISQRVLYQMDDLVDKVENNRYDAALVDTLRALCTVYGDQDPISVRQDHNGALNIEVNSQPGVDPIYDGNLFRKTEQACASGKRTMDHQKSLSATGRGPSCNDDIKFVSPISRRNINNITKDSNPGDETKEIADLVEKETAPAN